MTRIRIGGAVLVFAGVLMAVGVFVPSVNVASRLVTNGYSAADTTAGEDTFSSWTLFTRCDRRSVVSCELGEVDRVLEVDIDSATVPHGVPFLVIAALLSGIGVIALLTGRASSSRALVAWGSVVCAAIAVGFMFIAIDGTMHEFDLGSTTSGIRVLVVAVAVGTVGALLTTRFEQYGSPHRSSIDAALRERLQRSEAVPSPQ